MGWHSRLNGMGEENASLSVSLPLPRLPDDVTATQHRLGDISAAVPSFHGKLTAASKTRKQK